MIRAGCLFTALLGSLLAATGVAHSQTTNLAVTTNDATALTGSTAELHGVLTAGSAPSAGWFEWGTSEALGSKTEILTFPDGSAAISFAQSLKNLQPHRTYYFRAVGYRSLGIVSGDIESFTTIDGPTTPTSLTVATSEATAINSNSVALNGAINPDTGPTSVWFNWGTTSSMGTRTEMQPFTGTSPTPIRQVLKNLQPHTTYYFRAEAYRPSDAANSLGEVKSFRTGDKGAAPSSPCALATRLFC